MRTTVLLVLGVFVMTWQQQAFAQGPATVLPSAPAVAEMPGKITMDMKGMEISDALKMLASRSGMSIVVGKNVSGRLTLFLKDVDVWSAFEIILFANDLAYEEKDGIVYVMTQRDYEAIHGQRFLDTKKMQVVKLQYAKAADIASGLNQMKSAIGKVVVDENSDTLVVVDAPEVVEQMMDFIESADTPVRTKVFDLKYAQAEKLGPKVQDALTKGVGSIKVDERTNKIAVTDYPARLKEIEHIVGEFDEKTQQVLIDAQVIEVKPSDKLEMGVDWEVWIRKYFKITAALPVSHTGRLLLGTADLLTSGKGDYKAIIDLLRTVGDTKVLSSPRIMALNNQEAKILVGSKEAYITSTTSQSGSGTTVVAQSVNFVDVGIKLYVTPTINADDFVTMKIKPEISSAELTDIKSVGEVTQVPIVTTSETETTVMVKNGVTIIIGGLRKDEKVKTVNKIPIMGDIPLLGTFFRKSSEEITKTDLVILLTPHIISGEKALIDLEEVRPQQGARTRMVNGELVTERMDSRVQDGPLGPDIKTEEEYRRYVWAKVQRLAGESLRASGAKGKADVVFTVERSGRLKGEPRVASSNSHSLYVIAIKSIANAAPFPAFPEAMGKQETVFHISFYSE